MSDFKSKVKEQKELLKKLQTEHMPRQTGLLLYLVLGDVNVTLPVLTDRFVPPKINNVTAKQEEKTKGKIKDKRKNGKKRKKKRFLETKCSKAAMYGGAR